MSYHLTTVRIAIIKKSSNSKCWRGCREKVTLLHCTNWQSHYRGFKVRKFFKKIKIELPCDPAIPLLGIYPEKTMVQNDTCTQMFVAALFTIAKTGKQPKCPSTDEWRKQRWYICTMETQPLNSMKQCCFWQHGWVWRLFD